LKDEGYCKTTLSKAKQKAARIQKRKKVLWISVPPRRGVMKVRKNPNPRTRFF
jgi:hypothetical protein